MILDRAMLNVSSPFADSDGSDQPAHPRSLIRAFTVR